MTGIRDRLSRSGSSVSHGSSTCCSTNMASCPTDSRLTLSLEHRPCEPPLPLQVTKESEPKTEGNGHVLSARVLSHLKQCTPERPDLSSLRRRSMFVPGVATRTSAGKPLLEQLPPKQTLSLANRDYFSEKPSQLEVPLRSLLTALDLAEDGRRSGSSGGLRATTPCDIEYSNLGCFKLGTLHITNGAASPVPSTRTTGIKSPLSEDAIQAEGYFSIGEGRNTPRATSHTTDGNMLHGTLNYNQSLAVGGDHRTANVLGEKPLPNPRVEGDSADPETDAVGEPSRERSLAKFDFSTGPPDRTSIIAQEYISELPSSPFMVANPPSLSNWTISPFEDEGFVPSPTQSNERSVEPEGMTVASQAGCREDALQNLTGTAKGWPAKHRRLTSSSTGSQTASLGLSLAESQAEQGKYLEKADSGYSSTLSLKSLSEEEPVETTNDTSSTNSRTASSIYTVDMNSSLTQPRVPTKIPPPLPPKAPPSKHVKRTKGIGAIPTKLDLPSHPSHPNITEEFPPLPPKLNVQRLQSTPRPISLPGELSESVAARPPVMGLTTGLHKNLGDAPDPGVQRPPRKLHKSARALKPPVTVQVRPEINEPQVPPVPSEVVARHAGRFRKPSALAYTRPRTLNLHHSADNDRPNVRLAHVSFPWVTDDEAPELNEKESTKEHRSGSMRLLSRTVRRHKSDSKLNIHPVLEGPEVMPDLETVMASLGNGPYDVVMSTLSTPRRPQSSHDIYPHQIGRVQKSRSTVGMDNKAAALLARQRSKDIAESGYRGLNRPHSFCPSEYDEQEIFSNKLYRQRSLLADAPPIPSVPAVHLRETHSAMTVHSPPEVLITNASARKLSGTEHRSVTASSSSLDGNIELYKRTRRQRRMTANAELLGRYQSAISFQCDPIVENPLQESGGKSKKSGIDQRYSSELLHSHGLDLRDVPVSVQG